ncbi:hypothetical protein TRIP_E70003 [uncultured Spirochaetota bacterium]|nr:hypothetical protein TRIP_E70003 [uncultured Spirochaetota bacterium]
MKAAQRKQLQCLFENFALAVVMIDNFRHTKLPLEQDPIQTMQASVSYTVSNIIAFT